MAVHVRGCVPVRKSVQVCLSVLYYVTYGGIPCRSCQCGRNPRIYGIAPCSFGRHPCGQTNSQRKNRDLLVLLCFTEPTQTSLIAIPVDSKQSEEKERFVSALVFHRTNSNEKKAMFCADMSLESHESAPFASHPFLLLSSGWLLIARGENRKEPTPPHRRCAGVACTVVKLGTNAAPVPTTSRVTKPLPIIDS